MILEAILKIILVLFFLYMLWHGYVVIVAFRWKQQDRLIARALAPRDDVR